MQGNEHEPSETPTESGLARSQSSLHASAAHLSDEDDKGERSAREQLKKASLVNKATQPLSNDLLRPQKAVDDLTTVASSASGSGSSVESSAANIAVPAVENGLQGETDTKANLSSRQGTAGVNDIIVDEEDVTAVDMENDTPGRGSTSVIDKSKTQAVKPSHEQLHDRREGGSSPRKKRSRDQLDNDVDREQKIVATEEARAQRLSSEGDRKDLEKHHSQSAHVTEQTSKQPRTVFGSVNTVSEASKGPEAPKPFGSSPQRPASPSAFASSGFAALASSSASPFGAFAPADSSSSPFSSRNTAPAGHMGQKLKRESVLSSQNQLLQSTSSDSNPVAAFAGATQKAATGSVFGGSLFNRGFNGSFGTGQKLTSFAAPNGDARLGGESRVKPIGSLKEVDPAEQSADSEAEEAEEIGKDEPSLDEDERFHSQDVETGEAGEETLFASRASLFSFRDNAWKESGKGVFKFNIALGSTGEGSTNGGRFIMRAHQTFRVLLNAPVFKEMKVGDSKGNEPIGKSFAFAVIENGKPTPHMVKLGDTAESKDLYSAVQNLQRHLDP